MRNLSVINTCVITVFSVLVVLPELGLAERTETSQQQQQEMDQIMVMLKKGGMDPKQMQQMQDMFKVWRQWGANNRQSS